VTTELERLRVAGEPLGGDNEACYLAELTTSPGGLVATAYLLDESVEIEWDDWIADAPP
jgi:hypothetical protein